MALLRWLTVSPYRMHMDAKKQPALLIERYAHISSKIIKCNYVKGGRWCHGNGKRVKVNLLSRNENNGSGIPIFDNEWTISFWENPHFLGKKSFVLLFAFLFVELEFSFLLLKYFIYFKRRSFRSGIAAKVYLGEKAHFPSFTIFFPFAEFLRWRYRQRVKVSQIIYLYNCCWNSYYF